jgi:iron complex outermembrane receptor protein
MPFSTDTSPRARGASAPCARHKQHSFAHALLWLSLIPGAVFAQATVKSADDAMPFDTACADAADKKCLATMVVTATRPADYFVDVVGSATKTAAPLMETPVSVQVVAQPVLQDQQATSLDKALQNVAGVIASSSNQGLSDGFLIRGFGSNTTYRDGFLRPDILGGGTSKGEMANIEKIEVIKGPGSVLFGRTEPGGLINIVTKQPLPEARTAVQQQVGSDAFYRTTVDSTGPVGDGESLLYRVNLSYAKADSFRDFVEDEGYLLAPTLKYVFSEQTDATLEVEYQNFQDTPDAGILPLNGRPADVPRSRVIFEPESNVNDGDRLLASLTWTHRFNERWEVRHRLLSERFQIENLTLFTGALQPDGTLERFFNNGGNQDSKRYSTTLDVTGKLMTGAIRHTVLFGVDYFRVTDALIGLNCCDAAPPFNLFDPIYNPDPQVFDPANNFDLHFRQSFYGVYAQDQIELPGNVHVLAGLRYDNARGSNSGVTTTHNDHLTPRIGALWQPDHDVSLYVTYTSNFGASNSLFNPPDRPLPPQTAQQWEAGVKSEWFDGRLAATLSTFDLTKQNTAVTDPQNPDDQIAIGKSRTKGFEFELIGALAPGWQVIGGLAYMPYAKVTKDVQPVFDDQGNVVGSGPGFTGNRLFLAPRRQGSVWTTYAWQAGQLRGLKVGVGTVSVSRRPGDPGNSYILPGYAVVNAMASYAWQVGGYRLTAQLNADNLANRRYYPGSNGGSLIGVGAPRSVLASLKVEF